MKTRTILLMCVLPAILCTPAFARIIYVSNGSSPADFNNIQAAIDDANNGDTVLVAPGTYTGNGNRDISFKGKATTVRSLDPNDPDIVASTIIDCQGSEIESHRGFYFLGSKDSNAVILGLTISNGYYPKGGGIRCDEYSKPKIQLCQIINCFSNRGGGIYIGNESVPIIDNCIIANNSADNPSYRGEGAGVYYSGNSGNPVISNCIIANNQTLYSQNVDKGVGGGIYTTADCLTVRNCTIVGNHADSGGGIGINQYRTINIINCNIYYNDGSEIEGRATVSYSNIQGGFPGEGNIDLIPEFSNPDNNDFHLLPTSPCIDSGDSEFVPFYNETDIDGNTRVMGQRVDIGADEYISTPTPVIRISPNSFVFNADEGESNRIFQLLYISAAGDSNIIWEISEEIPWLQIYPTNGESSTESDEVSFRTVISGLLPDTYTGEVTVTDNRAPNSPLKIPVTLNIRPVAGILNVPLQYQTIQSAINAAQNGDVVILKPGIYSGLDNIDLDFMGKAITVQSINPKDSNIVDATVIDCKGQGRGFFLHSGEGKNSIISGLTITNGSTSDGAGIYINNSSPVVMNCIIINNSGGGLYIRDSNSMISYCTISNNISQWNAGGIFCYDGSPIITNCTISNNQAFNDGAGICFMQGENPSVINCVIKNNIMTFRRGGGISCRNSNLTIENCLFENNYSKAGGGGGIWLDYSNIRINQCTFIGNSTGYNGGAIYFEVGNGTINNCIFKNNTASKGPDIAVNSWSGVYTDGPIPYDPEPYPVAFLSVSYSDIQGGQNAVYVYNQLGWFSLNWGKGNIDKDPLFAKHGYLGKANDPNIVAGPRDQNVIWIEGDYHLKSQAGRWDSNTQSWMQDDVTSPCIDAGEPNSPIGLEPFPNGGRINMGAYGGTAEASKSYFGKPVCETIVAGDINGDCRVDILDFEIMLLHWMEDNNP